MKLSGDDKNRWFKTLRSYLLTFGYSPEGWNTAIAGLSVLAGYRISSHESAINAYIRLHNGELTPDRVTFDNKFLKPLRQKFRLRFRLNKDTQPPQPVLRASIRPIKVHKKHRREYRKWQRQPHPKKGYEISLFYKSAGWRKLRYKTLLRYGPQCMCCGSKKGPFNVDHIKPVKKYWHLRFDPNNTQVLCELCNLGKGSWDETDFRVKTDTEKLAALRDLSDEYARLVEAKSYGED
jgi:5-methylcytosine-specific restriction endonuclease McrA